MKRSYECSGDYNCQHDCEDKNCCSAVAHANLLQQNVTQSFRMSSRLHGRNADRFIQDHGARKRPTKAQPTSVRAGNLPAAIPANLCRHCSAKFNPVETSGDVMRQPDYERMAEQYSTRPDAMQADRNAML
jgi:hypothetical protein